MSPPWRATYRLQLRQGMNLDRAARLVPLLDRLAVSHLYLSPITTARPGSTHGYDATDLAAIDPALGGEEAFRRLSDRLRRHGLGLLLDFVPNHMGIAPENAWWWSVLAEGPRNRFARHFDIDWQRFAGPRGGRVLLPVLAEPYGRVLAKEELRLALDTRTGKVELRYHEQRLPVATDTIETIDPVLPALLGRGADEAARQVLEAASAPGRLHRVLERQHYRLAHWRMAGWASSYRRFFDINELIGLRVEDEAVFEASHALVLRLVREGRLDGLRIDHVDGLADPAAYLERLERACRAASGREARFPVWVEKILEPGETLPAGWPVAGTTGYDYLNLAQGLFLGPEGLERLGVTLRSVAGIEASFEEVAARARRLVLERLFAGEHERLAGEAATILADDPVGRDLPLPLLRRALGDLLAAFPVYRTYVDAQGAAPADEALIDTVARAARASTSLEDTTAIDALARLLEGREPAHVAFAVRFQQLSGPLMAKALEDTAFYRWHRLIAANEVGGAPGRPATTIAAFHEANARRLGRHPRTMLASATHDTKRGEDARARLAVLSEAAELWEEAVAGWLRRNATLRTMLADGPAPGADAEYLFYQSLVGVWPLDPGGRGDLADRLAAYMRKALREAKERTCWTSPNEPYEEAVERFVRAALDPAQSGDFLDALEAFVRRLAPAAAINGLALTLLKLASPGLPDLYQGTGLWDLSLVDPDNRRPVDFALREAVLEAGSPPVELLAGWRDGRVKLALIARILEWHQRWPEVAGQADYRPLATSGPAAAHLVAFARGVKDGPAMVAVVPRLVLGLLDGTEEPLVPQRAWQDTGLVLPSLPRGAIWHNVLTGERHAPGAIGAGALLATFPVAFLASTT